jgi:hypothetical protein
MLTDEMISQMITKTMGSVSKAYIESGMNRSYKRMFEAALNRFGVESEVV